MRRFLYLALLAALAAGCGGGGGLEDGEKALALGNYQMAAKCFKNALKAHPSSISLLYNLGTAQAMSGDSKVAIATFRDILRLTPGDLDASEALAAELRKSGSPENLLESHDLLDFTVSFRQGMEKARALNSLALTEMALRKNDLALARLIDAFDVAPGYAPTHFNYAVLLSRELNLPAKAVEELNKFTASPDAPAELSKKAKSLRDSLVPRIAAPYSHKTTPEASALAKRGAEAYAKRDYKSAENAFAAASAADPLDFESALNRAHSLLALGRTAEARSAYAEASALNPARQDAAFWHPRLAYAEGDCEEATRLFTGVFIPQWPEDPQGILYATYAYTKLQRYYEARVYGALYLAVARKSNPKAKLSDFESWLAKLPETKFKP